MELRHGDIANERGDIRIVSFSMPHNLSHGRVFVTEVQAERATRYGWKIIGEEGSGADLRVLIER